MSEKRKINLSIVGKEYSIITDENEAIVYEAAKMIDGLLKSTLQESETLSGTSQKVVFVTLKVAVDLIKKQRELETVLSKTKDVNDLIDSECGECAS